MSSVHLFFTLFATLEFSSSHFSTTWLLLPKMIHNDDSPVGYECTTGWILFPFNTLVAHPLLLWFLPSPLCPFIHSTSIKSTSRGKVDSSHAPHDTMNSNVLNNFKSGLFHSSHSPEPHTHHSPWWSPPQKMIHQILQMWWWGTPDAIRKLLNPSFNPLSPEPFLF